MKKTIASMLSKFPMIDGCTLWNLIDNAWEPESAWAYLEGNWTDAAHAPRNAAAIRYQIICWAFQQMGIAETLRQLCKILYYARR